MQINIEQTVKHKIQTYEQLCIRREHINPFVVDTYITHIFTYNKEAFQLCTCMTCCVGIFVKHKLTNNPTN